MGGGQGPVGPGGGGNFDAPPPVDSHIINASDDVVKVTVAPFSATDAEFEKLHEWFEPAKRAGYNYEFDWWTSTKTLLSQQANGVDLMTVQVKDGSGDIEALATFSRVLGSDDLPEIYIGLVEAAAWNQPGHPQRRNKATFAAVLEGAIKESLRRGYNGCVSLVALKPEQVKFYGRYGFDMVSEKHRVMELTAQNADRHLRKMEADRD